jgi:chaperone BCS1
MWQFIQHQLQTNQFLSTGLVVSVMGALVLALKQMPGQLYNKAKSRFVFSATVYQFDPLYNDFELWFFNHHGDKYRYVEAVSQDQDTSNSPRVLESAKESRKRKVSYKQIDGVFFIKHKGQYILVSKNREKLEHSSDVRNLFMNQYTFKAIRGAEIIKDFLNECIELNSQKEPNELKVWTHNPYGDWYISGCITSKQIENVILPIDVKAKILYDIKEFQSSKEWYKKASIFYKRGHLYHGLPGNGKTSLSMAISSFMGRDLYCMDLNILSDNDSLKRTFNNISSHGVLLIEDIDGFYNQREAIKKDSKISFSTFLNCLDGAFYKEGLFTIITTNKLNSVDAALMRNGRMDKVIEIPQPGIDEINQYLNAFYGADDLKLLEYTASYSMCDIQEICMRHKNDPRECINELNGQKHLNIAI